MKPRSMEEKIGYRLFLMGFVGLLCTAALCIFVFHKAFRTQVLTAMEHEADLVSAGYRLSGDPRQLSAYSTSSLRMFRERRLERRFYKEFHRKNIYR